MERQNLFTTPIFKESIGDDQLNDNLTETVGVMMSDNPESPVQKSNMGGWHSEETIFEPKRMNSLGNHGDSLYTLGERIDDVFHKSMDSLVDGWKATLDMSGWVTVLKENSWNSPHTHPGASWSFIYYVDSGNADKEEGCIIFEDPRSAAIQHVPTPGKVNKNKYRVKPEDGLLMLFPSWLEHYVTPYYSNDLRIGISGNISMTNIKT